MCHNVPKGDAEGDKISAEKLSFMVRHEAK